MSDVIISGYHGYANSGDEALLYAILNTLRKQKPDIGVTVLSKVPDETASEYNVNSVYRYNFFKIKKAMQHSKLLLFGGGSLLQDVTSSKSILYYLTIINMAHKCGLKIMLYANGIGPITKKINRHLCSKILNKVDIITLRDDKSDEELKKLGVTTPRVIITADPAFTIDTGVSFSGEYYTKRAGVPVGTKLCVVSIRDYKKFAPDFISQMAKLCDYSIEKHNIYPLFVPMQYPLDMEISRKVMAKMKNESYIINRELSVAEMFSVMSEAELVIGMRLHSLIYATTLAIPAMALVYDPKVSAFMGSLNQPDCISAENFRLDDAKQCLDGLVYQNEKRRKILCETNKELRKKAEDNTGYAIELLEKSDD
ncbi:MAG: polysaccharide pyruvyl transferase CsaB [Clostridia bacterium]|nr:polysaccharide pyruvyl transferase CsaB [Clostridia bacterium]